MITGSRTHRCAARTDTHDKVHCYACTGLGQEIERPACGVPLGETMDPYTLFYACKSPRLSSMCFSKTHLWLALAAPCTCPALLLRRRRTTAFRPVRELWRLQRPQAGFRRRCAPTVAGPRCRFLLLGAWRHGCFPPLPTMLTRIRGRSCPPQKSSEKKECLRKENHRAKTTWQERRGARKGWWCRDQAEAGSGKIGGACTTSAQVGVAFTGGSPPAWCSGHAAAARARACSFATVPGESDGADM